MISRRALRNAAQIRWPPFFEGGTSAIFFVAPGVYRLNCCRIVSIAVPFAVIFAGNLFGQRAPVRIQEPVRFAPGSSRLDVVGYSSPSFRAVTFLGGAAGSAIGLAGSWLLLEKTNVFAGSHDGALGLRFLGAGASGVLGTAVGLSLADREVSFREALGPSVAGGFVGVQIAHALGVEKDAIGGLPGASVGQAALACFMLDRR